MLAGWFAILVFSAYAAGLLALALWGDQSRAFAIGPFRRKAIYVLSSCVYCSAWSYFGSVAIASRSGIDYLPIYLGPALAFALFHPTIVRMIRLAKSQKITSVADFIASRYGKAASVAATVTVIATLASIPYIALQIRAVSQALAIFVDGRLPSHNDAGTTTNLIAIVVTLLLAGLTIAIGARRVDATEHQRGLMFAVAFESIVKLVAFLAVGAFVTWGMFDGIGDLTEKVVIHPAIAAAIDKRPDASLWTSIIFMTLATILFLPRQFHVSVVENIDESDVRTAAWFVPLYILVLNLFVMPIAVAGLATFPPGAINRDFTVLALPIQAGSPVVALLALLGSMSAATSMILVSTTVLAVMVSNDLVMPFLLWAQRARPATGRRDHTPPILLMRRVAIVAILGASVLFTEIESKATLASVGLLSLAAVAQISPAAIGGLFWARGTARGAIGGSIAGILVIAYTLLLPDVVPSSSAIMTQGPLGLDALRPTDLFGLELAPFAQALVWSLITNVAVYCLLSLTRPATISERLQANVFVRTKTMSFATSFRLRHSMVSTEDLLACVARYLGLSTAQRLFFEWHATRGLEIDVSRDADTSLIQYAEQLIASSIGAASSRMVISLLLQEREMSPDAARQIVDDAALEIQNSRDVLQHAIDVAHDGMAIFDSDLRLVAWNRAYRDMFQLPADLMRIGTPLDVLVRSNAERGVYGSGPVDTFVGMRLEALTRPTDGQRLYSAPYGRILEMRSVRLHNGGLFFTYTDATAQVTSEEELEAENLTLERRVRERTEELQRLNVELVRAKAESEDANISKSRFLAAASHDLLQPLSAARLYTTSLRERLRSPTQGDAAASLAANVDASLEAVEDILGALLEISHLDAGATRTEITTFGIADMLRQLKMEFEPMACERGLRLRFVPSSLRVKSDRKLLRRMLQNLISNAVKYTVEGSVLIGARKIGAFVRLDVFDTGIGIPYAKQKIIFREFERLPAAIEASAGAGLGLSIVERLSRVLDHELSLRSVPERGSAFSVIVPLAEAFDGAATGIAPGTPPRPRSLEGLKVAAIDNELHILSAMTLLLQGWDCVVANGTNLREIERMIEGLGCPPDVIVADYHLDETDGLGVIAALRDRYGPLPAVLVTADRSPIIKDLANTMDVRVLNKPLKPAALRSLLSQWYLVKAATEQDAHRAVVPL